MFGPKHYVPVLRGKLGEYQALRDLDAAARDLMTPLIDIPQVPWDWDTDLPAKTVAAHLATLATRLEGCGFGGRPFFIDPLMALDATDPNVNLIDGQHALVWLTAQAALKGVRLVPVTGLSRSAEYQTAVSAVVTRDQLGVCLRLQPDDLGDFNRLTAEIGAFLTTLNIEPANVDLIVDFKDIPQSDSQAGLLLLGIIGSFSSLPRVSEWRSLTFAGSSFPVNLSGLPADSMTRIQRREYAIWLELVARRASLPRVPSFGDYGISSAEPGEEINPKIMLMSANLRYTAEPEWLVFKGRNTREHGYDQFAGFCQQLIGMPEFSGAGFSAGDRYISDCAAGTVTSGNATTWRRLGTNHHVTLAGRQIASNPDL